MHKIHGNFSEIKIFVISVHKSNVLKEIEWRNIDMESSEFQISISIASKETQWDVERSADVLVNSPFKNIKNQVKLKTIKRKEMLFN